MELIRQENFNFAIVQKLLERFAGHQGYTISSSAPLFLAGFLSTRRKCLAHSLAPTLQPLVALIGLIALLPISEKLR